MSKHRDMQWGVYRPTGLIFTHENYLDGVVETPHGFVVVYSERSYASVRIIYAGRTHMRTWNRAFTKRGLAIVASRFANEVVSWGNQ